jgi:predicted short-subunit dehydrogenase-like oxidoreductase (DUF2520 family)
LARKNSITIVGAGNVARVLAPALRRAGYRVDEIVSRDRPDSVRRAKALARASRSTASTFADARLTADVIWICSTDDAIASTAQLLGKRRDILWSGKIVLHASGAMTSDELGLLKKRGASVASAHFMQTFAPGSNPTLRVPFAVEGDKRAKEVALKIGRDLGAKPFLIRKQNKVLYHAMGSFSSPMIVAVLSLGEELGRVAGLSKKEIKLVMAPIFLRTGENYLKKGTKVAFGGPINRGNIATVKKQLQELKKVPDARAAYLALATAAIKRLPVANKKELERLFKNA